MRGAGAGDEFIGVRRPDGGKAQELLDWLCRQVEETQVEEGFSITISAGVVEAGEELRLVKLSELGRSGAHVPPRSTDGIRQAYIMKRWQALRRGSAG